MPYSPIASNDILQRAKRIRLVGFDVDGTLTDGRLFYDNQGGEYKAFSVRDGQGLVLLRQAGFDVVLITARNSQAAERRAAELGIAIRTGVSDKRVCLQEHCIRQGYALDEVAFMGDDLPDLTCLRMVGLAVAPADAHPWIAESVHWRTQAPAGQGAARELCDLLLTVQSRLPASLTGRQSE